MSSVFIVAAILDMTAALLHVGCILGGPSWYRFFGAGERIAQMAEKRHIWPTVLTAGIATVLAMWGLYFLSLGGFIPALPFLTEVAWLVTVVYLIRGLYPLLAAPFVALFRTPFMQISSAICLIYGGVHLTCVLTF